MEDNFELFMKYIVIPLLVILTCALLVSLPISFFQAYKNAQSPTFVLKKNEWSCSKIYEYESTNMIIIGKSVIPQRITHKDCIEWSHK